MAFLSLFKTLQSESNIERRNKKKLGNVCHQSFAVEDEEDGADDINYAMQQPSPNPPPLPNSAPPIPINAATEESASLR